MRLQKHIIHIYNKHVYRPNTLFYASLIVCPRRWHLLKLATDVGAWPLLNLGELAVVPMLKRLNFDLFAMKS